MLETRKQIFKKNKVLKEKILSDIEATFQQKGKSTKEDRKELLANEFFKLSESVLTSEGYTKTSASYYTHFPAPARHPVSPSKEWASPFQQQQQHVVKVLTVDSDVVIP